MGFLVWVHHFSRSFSSSLSSAADFAAGYADDFEISHREKYDVFISFRGEDTRRGITSHLHQALKQSKIETYIDYRLPRGEEIEATLLEAIEKSRLSVIIFSKNYPSSTWCLKELVHILKCQERGQMVTPVFYDISPSDIRNQQGSYKVAFAGLEERFKDNLDKVREWRNALTTAANLAGFDYYSSNTWTEADLIKNVVDDIWNKLIRESSCDLKGLVGIDRHIEQIESLLCIHSPGSITVGIWGMGGIGKTTIAENVFHKLSSKFDASCFLRNVRANSEQKDGLDCLEKIVLKEILKKEDLSTGSTLVRENLSRTKVLIVLDDVSDSMQMEHLAGDRLQYGTGSKVIITSRDRRTLRSTVKEDKIYKVVGLKPDDALELFCSRAFMNNSTPRTEYKELAKKAVDYAGGIPLALVHLGYSFLNYKRKEEWEDELNKLKEFPNEKIQKALRLSYDGLETIEKEIFLDIACFHRGRNVDEVKRMLAIRGFFVESTITNLVDMSLISIDSTRKTIEMHDLLQELGSTIVLEQCIEDPGQRSRLFKYEDVHHVLQNNMGTSKVQAILVNWYKIEEQTLKRADFKVMSNLMMLRVGYRGKLTASLELPNSLRYLHWEAYPLKCLPSNFCPENLVELHMPGSRVKKLWNEEQRLVKLKVINLEWSTNLTEVPNLSGSREIVQINLCGCKSLAELPRCFKHLHKLTHLNLSWCKSLKYIPEMPENVEFLKLLGSGIQELPESVWSHEKISYLDIRNCKDLKKLPSNRCKLKVSGCFDLKYNRSLEEFSELPRYISELSFVGCDRLASLPTDICKLKSLKKLNLSWCSKLENFPEILEPVEHLEYLNLKGTAVQELHSSIEFLPALKKIKLRNCERLSSIPESICKLKSLGTLYLSGTHISEIPDCLVGLTSLQVLNLSRSMIRSIPASIKQASQLNRLRLIGCKQLQSLPELPVQCDLKARGCTSLKTVSSSRTALTQGWDKHTHVGERNFLNCRKLDHNARSNIMDEAQLLFMRNATRTRGEYWKPQSRVVCPGKEIPKWFSFSYQSEGSSVHIKLPPGFFRTGLLGFVLSVVVSCVSNCGEMRVITAKCNVKSLGESHELFTSRFYTEMDLMRSADHVCLWYQYFTSGNVAIMRSADEASVEFHVPSIFWGKVKKCGICPLYAEDVEKFKLDLVSGEPKIQEETREDETWEASGSSYMNKANESDDESEAGASSHERLLYDSDSSDPYLPPYDDTELDRLCGICRLCCLSPVQFWELFKNSYEKFFRVKMCL